MGHVDPNIDILDQQRECFKMTNVSIYEQNSSEKKGRRQSSPQGNRTSKYETNDYQNETRGTDMQLDRAFFQVQIQDGGNHHGDSRYCFSNKQDEMVGSNELIF
jgi:hypothetical protein